MSLFSGDRSDGGGGSTWISGLISGAGKVISNVFRSEFPSPSSSSSFTHSYSSEEENADISSKECDREMQIEERSQPDKGFNERSLAIISEIEPKHAIEQLILQETFSREELNHLTKIIQSRLSCGHGSPMDVFERPTGNAIAFTGAWKSINLTRGTAERFSFSPSNLDAVSPSFSSRRVLTPDLRDSAILEGKKWLDEKRLTNSSNADQCRTCTPITVPQYDVEGEVGSPVDMAKSYMRSLPPWKCSPLRINGTERTPRTSTHNYTNTLSYAAATHSLPSTKGLKRRHLDLGSHDTYHELRNVRMKATETVQEASNFKQMDSLTKRSGNEACQTYSTEKRTYDDPRNLSAVGSQDASASSTAKLCVQDSQPAGALALPNELAEVSTPARIGSIISVSCIPDSEEVVNAVQKTNATSLIDTLPLRADSATTIPENNQDLEEDLVVKRNDPIPHSIEMQHIGDGSENVTNSSQVEISAGSEQFGHVQADAEVNRSLLSSTQGLDTGLHAVSEGEPKPIDMYEGSREPSVATSDDAPQLKKTTSKRGRPRGGTLKKPVKDATTETQPSTSLARGRKLAPRPRRGRGK